MIAPLWWLGLACRAIPYINPNFTTYHVGQRLYSSLFVFCIKVTVYWGKNFPGKKNPYSVCLFHVQKSLWCHCQYLCQNWIINKILMKNWQKQNLFKFINHIFCSVSQVPVCKNQTKFHNTALLLVSIQIWIYFFALIWQKSFKYVFSLFIIMKKSKNLGVTSE